MDESILEAGRLKEELEAMSSAKAELERREAELIQERRDVDGKNLKLLVERSALITECDTLTAVVKKFELKVAELQQQVFDKEGLVKDLAGERDKVRADLDDSKQELTKLQGEALKSYEDGYQDCWNRFASGVNVNPASNTFEIFLSDLRAKASRDEAGSSNQAHEADA